MPDPQIDVQQDAAAEGSWGPVRLYGGQIDQVGNPPKPRVTQTGSWSEPYFPADEGQDGNALKGALALRDHWLSKKGGVYAVDPQTMGMEHGIDIGQQIQESIDQDGHMRGVLDQALKSGRPVPFDTSKWGLRRFDDHPLTPDGATVGRWGGFVQGTLSAQPDGTWSVKAGLWPQKTGQYDFKHDAGGGPVPKFVGNRLIDVAHAANGDGAPFWINFNRVYNFSTNGRYENSRR